MGVVSPESRRLLFSSVLNSGVKFKVLPYPYYEQPRNITRVGSRRTKLPKEGEVRGNAVYSLCTRVVEWFPKRLQEFFISARFSITTNAPDTKRLYIADTPG